MQKVIHFITERTKAFGRYIKDHKWGAIIVLLLLLGVGGSAYAKRPQPPELAFVKPEYRDLTKTLEVSGVVDAKEKARLRFIAGGKVTYLGAKEGDTIKKWQTLARIDPATLQKQLEKDLNLYLKERYDWEDTRDDIKDRSLDTTEYRAVDRNQLDLTNTVLDVEIRDIAIQNTVITAPFAGILTVAPAVTPGIQLISTDYFEIVNPETLLFRAEVDEADIGHIKEAQEAAISLDSFPDQELKSAISYISYTSAQTSSGTVFMIEFPLTEQNDTLLRIGMNGEAAITLEHKPNVLSVPFDSIRERDGKSYVDVRTGENTAAEREVAIGLTTDEYAEVTSGLSESDEIVLPE